MSLYAQRGVSAHKEDVLSATASLDSGLYPRAFCKIYPDYLGNDVHWVNVMHADGAGTKSILAYLYWKETGDISVWRGIAQDAIVMNLDDLLCVGITDNLVFNSTIDRNKQLIPGEVLDELIQGNQSLFNQLQTYGVNIHYLGGETADVGDVVRTVAVNGTMTARWPANRLITNEKIQVGNVIIGLESHGQANYESFYNSGIGSNGLTSARHDALVKEYARLFPESFDPKLNENVCYIGKNRLTDPAPNVHFQTIGQMLLSPTRTYAPVIRKLLDTQFDQIHGLIHCSGGGQTKCLKYMPSNVRVVKDGLPEPPPIFNLLQANSGCTHREMLEVFNMGIRLEIYCPEESAQSIIELVQSFGVGAHRIGRVEADVKKSLEIHWKGERIVY
jgi:phosphoribosylformylglycinamidine cyclo-ligase